MFIRSLIIIIILIAMLFVCIGFFKFLRIQPTKTIEKIGIILKTIGFILLSLFALLGGIFFNFFIHDITHPRIIGSSSIYLKNLFHLQKDYPQIERIFGATIKDFAILGDVNPFLSSEDPTVKTIDIQSGTTFSVFPNDTYDYNLIIENKNLKHAISPKHNSVVNDGNVKDDFYTSKVIELKFKNARLFIHNMELYNPTFTGFWSPYKQIDYQFLGGDYLSTIGGNLYTGDFCLALYATPLIHASWKQDFPDCHLITLSRLADYPYTILGIFLTPIDTNIPATMQTIYHTINHNL